MSVRIFQLLAIITVVFLLVIRPPIFNLGPSLFPKHTSSEEVTAPLLGVDVSHRQGVIDWHKVSQSGIKFAYLKATDGVTYQDPAFFDYAKGIADTTLLVGAYHFFEAEDDPIAQAKNFVKQVGSVSMTLVPMVDVEVTKGQTGSSIASRLESYVQYISATLGCKPIIYSSRNFWLKDIGPAFNDHLFWLADYSEILDVPKGLKQLVIWQYSDKGKVNGVGTEVDMDRILDGVKSLESLKCKY